MSFNRMDEGFAFGILFNDVGGFFWQKAVTPPGLTNGTPIDTTDMLIVPGATSDYVKTKSPQTVNEITDLELHVAYSAEWCEEAYAAVGLNQMITLIFPDSTTQDVWGYMQDWKPEEAVIGQQPMGRLKIVITNVDYTLGNYVLGRPAEMDVVFVQTDPTNF